jgi:arsenate reductase
MILYGLKTCDTCRKARKALPQAAFVDVRETGVPQAILSDAYTRFAGRLLNTRSTTWRGLSDEERDRPPLELLQDYPTLMKRPLGVDGDQMVLGWDKAAQAELGV